MIKGIGVDIIEIERIGKAIRNERFLHRVFTQKEIAKTNREEHRLAGIFAAKESLLKAMKTGLNGFSWQEIEINHTEKGAPYLKVRGKVEKFLTDNKIGQIHLSISHSHQYAVAQVILEEGL